MSPWCQCERRPIGREPKRIYPPTPGCMDNSKHLGVSSAAHRVPVLSAPRPRCFHSRETVLISLVVAGIHHHIVSPTSQARSVLFHITPTVAETALTPQPTDPPDNQAASRMLRPKLTPFLTLPHSFRSSRSIQRAAPKSTKPARGTILPGLTKLRRAPFCRRALFPANRPYTFQSDRTY